MTRQYLDIHPWKIIENSFNNKRVKSSESIFSIGNGHMGQRANFEEDYSGETFQGSYIGGVYYPDKTKVGWWKNGYPEYFAKVLNAPNWIGIHIKINDETLDLNKIVINSVVQMDPSLSDRIDFRSNHLEAFQGKSLSKKFTDMIETFEDPEIKEAVVINLS